MYAPPKCDSPLCSFSTFATRFVQSHPDLEDSAALSLLEEPLADALEAINQVKETNKQSIEELLPWSIV